MHRFPFRLQYEGKESGTRKAIDRYEKEYKEYASEVKIYADSFDALKKENKKLQNDSKISMETRLQMGKQRMEYEEAMKVLKNIPEDVIRRYNYKSEQIPYEHEGQGSQ